MAPRKSDTGQDAEIIRLLAACTRHQERVARALQETSHNLARVAESIETATRMHKLVAEVLVTLGSPPVRVEGKEINISEIDFRRVTKKKRGGGRG